MNNLFKILLIMGLPGLTINSCRNKPDRDMSNPFFSEYNTPFEVPPFEKIMAKHYLPAFEKGISENREEIEVLIKSKQDPTFENTIEALDKSGELLTRVSSVFLRQIKANTNDSLKSLEMEISPRLAAFRDEINLNHKLFARVKYVYDNQSRFNLNQEQKFLLENLYRSFVRNGANLNKQDQDTLKRINQEISVLTVKFSQNVLKETNNYRLIVDKDGLAGLPESLINSAAGVAEAGGYEGKWAFTTQRPSIFPFLQNSPDRDLRRQIFNAYISRGNNGNEFDNNKILSDLIRLRAERARLLGYKTHSDYVLEPRMAKKPENVFALLNSLWEKAIPVAKKEVIELQKIIEKEGGNFKLEPSDWWYYAEKLRKQKYDLNDSDLRPYFKLDNVREGAFICAEKLFGITFAPIEGCPLPHPEVEAFEVKDSAGVHIGVLYMDFYPRDSKQQGAWCETYRSHHIVENKAIAPVVTTVFNFTRPTGEVPSLLSMEEVSTLFHEFGHAIDFLFRQNKYNKVYEIWDFVELPSQLMEHWVAEPEVLKMYAKHYETGEVIPASLVRKIINSGYFNQGFENVEVLAASMLDMAYYTLEAPAIINIQSFEKEYFNKIGLISEIISRYRSTYFLHIIDEYDSGYYSYTWAAVLDNDAYEAFREQGIFNRSVASSYRKHILEKNGTMDAMEMYINFRGREPQIEPLLKNRGLISQTN